MTRKRGANMKAIETARASPASRKMLAFGSQGGGCIAAPMPRLGRVIPPLGYFKKGMVE